MLEKKNHVPPKKSSGLPSRPAAGQAGQTIFFSTWFFFSNPTV